jgi:sec-independent protein translocase protein TatA
VYAPFLPVGHAFDDQRRARFQPGGSFPQEDIVGNLGAPELLLILAIVVILFGAGKVPQLGKGLGEGIRNFKHGMRDGEEPAKDQNEDSAESRKG